MSPLTYAYVVVFNFAHRRVEAMRDNDRGAPTIEYLGLALLVAGIVVVLMRSNFGRTISGHIESAIRDLFSQSQVGGGSGGGNRPAPDPNNGRGLEG